MNRPPGFVARRTNSRASTIPARTKAGCQQGVRDLRSDQQSSTDAKAFRLAAVVILGKLKAINALSLARQFGMASTESHVATERPMTIADVRLVPNPSRLTVIRSQNPPDFSRARNPAFEVERTIDVRAGPD